MQAGILRLPTDFIYTELNVVVNVCIIMAMLLENAYETFEK
jgi:hypothetical protein